MAKDYKKRAPAKKPAPAKRGFPGWAWMVVGLAIGLFAGFLFYLSKRPAPAPTAITLPAPPAHHPAKPVAKPTTPAEKKSTEPSKPSKPKFDFYTLLPELEVVVPKGNYTVGKSGQKSGSKPASTPPAQIETPGTYMLQTGSFGTYAQANRMKASLALLGFVSNISQVKVNSDTWYRVQIGPFKNLKKLNTARDELKKHHVDSLALKVNG